MYFIFVNQSVTTEYFNNTFPDNVGIVKPYNLRNINNYSVINVKTQLFRTFFIPSCMSSWNIIPEHIRDSETLASSCISLTIICLNSS